MNKEIPPPNAAECGEIRTIIDSVRNTLLAHCVQHKAHVGYDYWNDHIKLVVWHALSLADRYGADREIVELGALLHDISMPAEYGERSEHASYSAEMAEKILIGLGYPSDRRARVKACVYHHAGRNAHLRSSIEEHCVADGDALAHFDRIPSLFSLAYNVHKMELEEGRAYVKQRLMDDYHELTERTKADFEGRYKAIMAYLFVD
ncbi:MAG: HDIG domain-containing protein [Oscillospiraceae bacterium]|jgi:putative nucleotidyltransferase with HDIG domain|nr:HDIG domain-containing protein [Oscillospiraceae bacterium]